MHRASLSLAAASLVLAGVGVAAAPSCQPTIPNNTFVCAQDDECPEGQTCILGLCRSGWQCNNLCGDTDQDGTVDPADRAIIESLTNTEDACKTVTDAPTLCQCNAGDIDGNGDLDALDLAAFDGVELSCQWTAPLACAPGEECPDGQTCIFGFCRSVWQCNELCGDTNQDGTVDPADRAIIESLTNTEDACKTVTDAPTLCQCNAADVDGNGDLDALDLTAFDGVELSCQWTAPSEAPEFCVPQLLERVVVDSSISVDASHSLVWTGSQFLVVYKSHQEIIARTIAPNGTRGEAHNYGPIASSPPELTYSNGRVAAIMSPGGGAERQMMILDDAGAEVVTFPLPGYSVAIAFRDAFALLGEGSLTPMALDGTLGAAQPLTSEAVSMKGLFDAASRRLAIAHAPSTPCGDLTFSLVDADDFDTVSLPDVVPGGDAADPFVWKPASLVRSDDRLVLFASAVTYHSCDTLGLFFGVADIMKIYDADGVPISVELPIESGGLASEAVATDRYLLTSDFPRGVYFLFDRVGRPYTTEGPTGVSAIPLEKDATIRSAGVAAYSSDRVAFVYSRSVSDFVDELVFATFGCDD